MPIRSIHSMETASHLWRVVQQLYIKDIFIFSLICFGWLRKQVFGVWDEAFCTVFPLDAKDGCPLCNVLPFLTNDHRDLVEVIYVLQKQWYRSCNWNSEQRGLWDIKRDGLFNSLQYWPETLLLRAEQESVYYAVQIRGLNYTNEVLNASRGLLGQKYQWRSRTFAAL